MVERGSRGKVVKKKGRKRTDYRVQDRRRGVGPEPETTAEPDLTGEMSKRYTEKTKSKIL